MPFDVVAEHAQEYVGADAGAEPVIERPNLQIDGFERAEGALDKGERFVSAHGRDIVQVSGEGTLVRTT